MRAKASLLSPKAANISRGETREIFAVDGDNKLASIRIVSKYVFYYTKKTSVVGDADFLDDKQIRVIEL